MKWITGSVFLVVLAARNLRTFSFAPQASKAYMTPGRTQVGADLGLHHPGNPRAYTASEQLQSMVERHHPASSLLISMEGGGWLSAVIAGPCSWLALVNPSHWPANSSQGSTTRRGQRRGRTQPTQRAHHEYLAWAIQEAMPLDPIGHLLH